MTTLHSNSASGEALTGGGRFENTGATIAASRPDLLSKVSTAQQRVLEFLLAGLTEPQIAEKIGRSRHTVHDHTKAIYSALNVNNRVQLVLLFSQPPASTTPNFQIRPAATSQTTNTHQPISDVVFTQARPLAQNLSVA
ncbi:MAG: response regulator transcription factor [Planctomycetes bacterium]|nr:response regulator transcription factor [Planctomycetota bacterium]